MRSSRRAAAEHGASTSAEPAIWGRQAARQRSGWGQQDGELKTKTDGTETTTYTYDALNNLRQVVLPNADTIEYLVDGLGRRVGKKKNGTLVKRWLFKDQLEPIAEIDEPSGNVRRFIYASRAHAPDLMIDNTGVYRLLTDQLGSVRLVVRVSDGHVVQHVDYDPWGVPTVVTGGWGIQSFGFAGGVYDSDTGLVRFGARDYDARVGRWTGKDPVRFEGDGPNLYPYVLGDPVNLVDAHGTYAAPPPQMGPVLWIAGGMAIALTVKALATPQKKLNRLPVPTPQVCDDEPEPDQSGVYQRCFYVEEDFYACYYVCPGNVPHPVRKSGPGAPCQEEVLVWVGP